MVFRGFFFLGLASAHRDCIYLSHLSILFPANRVNFGFLLFLIFPEIPGLGHLWMNWTLAGSCAVGFLVLLLYRQQYRRLSVDSLRIVDQAQLHSALN